MANTNINYEIQLDYSKSILSFGHSIDHIEAKELYSELET